MFREATIGNLPRRSFPHTRGDVPAHRRLRVRRQRLFPTHVGMFRLREDNLACSLTFPHTRGDVPCTSLLLAAIVPFSPHTWGCSAADILGPLACILFPTHVGMFRVLRRFDRSI